jgi:hypothetical protein
MVASVGTTRTTSARILLSYVHPKSPPDTTSTMAFEFSELPPGGKETFVEWVNGTKCTEIQIRSATAQCIVQRCPFGAVNIVQATVPKLKSMKIDIKR